MNNSIFFQFQKPGNPIDALLEQFVSLGWSFPASKYPGITKYNWPDIVLSKDIRTYDNFKNDNPFDVDHETNDEKEYEDAIELLGCYRPKCSNWEIEGEIVLYYNKIYSTAENYSNEKGVDLNASFKNLSEIVLMHEFVHWVMHWVESPFEFGTCKSDKFIPFEYATIDNVNFHEAFTQLFTHFFCEWNIEKKELFQWLNVRQPEQYKKYRDLLDNGIKSSHEAIVLLSFVRFFKIQSFELLSKCIEILKKEGFKNDFNAILCKNGLSNIMDALPNNDKVLCLVNSLHDNIGVNWDILKTENKLDVLLKKIYPLVKNPNKGTIEEFVNSYTEKGYKDAMITIIKTGF